MPTRQSEPMPRLAAAVMLSAFLGFAGTAAGEEPVEEEELFEEEEAAEVEEWEGDPMDADEEWVEEVIVDESDDAIPAEAESDAAGFEWEVSEFVDDGDSFEEQPVSVVDGFREPGDLPTIRRATRGPRLGAGADDDVPFSTGGKPVRDSGAPWQAQIYYPRSARQWAEKLKQGVPLWQLQHYCGGAIILTDGAPTVVGVVSWGKKRCSGDGQPGAYTRVESCLDWIRQAMSLDPSKNALP